MMDKITIELRMVCYHNLVLENEPPTLQVLQATEPRPGLSLVVIGRAQKEGNDGACGKNTQDDALHVLAAHEP